MISLYFHIPFCKKKCPYCHFYVVPDRPLFHEILKEGLHLEWEQVRKKVAKKTVVSLYFGGGTPSLFPEGIEALLQRIRRETELAPDCEITLEANPDELSEELLARFFSMGINRLSLGVQSLDDRSLMTLERTHSAKKAKEVIAWAKKVGFSNLSIDLMYDLPDQTEASWRYSLDQLASLPIDHLSLYNLTIEPHTVFFKKREQLKLPDANLSLRMHEEAIEAIERAGLARYEISAFAKKGKESRHNVGYWTARPFLGLGPSAFSYWEGERFRNIAHLQRYTRALQEGISAVDFRETLLPLQSQNERLAIELRLLRGAPLSLIAEETSPQVEKLVGEGYLTLTATHVKLTERGLLFYDSVATDLI